MSKGRVLITGASSGIGKACALAFASQGYNLILTARRAEKLQEISRLITEKYSVDVVQLNFDVRNADEVKLSYDSLSDENKVIDILINNAGLAKGFDPIHEGSIEDWDTMIDTNVKGLLYITRLVSADMVKRNHGHIVNVASTAGKEVYPKGNVYCASKHAVEALTKSMRIDLHSKGIRVSQVSPGHVEETEFALVRFDGDDERAKIYEDFNPLTSRDVANAVMFIVQQPAHVNIQDILMMGTQQASNIFIDRSGRK